MRIILIFCFLLAGCVSHISSLSESTCCAEMCKTRLNSCGNSCRNNCSICARYAQSQAEKGYTKYQWEQFIIGGVVARDLQSYRDPLQCRKVTCNCGADFKMCIQACQGRIHKELRAAPVC